MIRRYVLIIMLLMITLNISCAQNVEGLRYDEAAQCWQGPQEAGWTSWLSGCGDVVTYAFDPEGCLWQFSNDCIPEDFVPASGAELGARPQSPLCGDQ